MKMTPFMKVVHKLTTQMTHYPRTISPTEPLPLHSTGAGRGDKSDQDSYLKNLGIIELKQSITQTPDLMQPED